MNARDDIYACWATNLSLGHPQLDKLTVRIMWSLVHPDIGHWLYCIRMLWVVQILTVKISNLKQSSSAKSGRLSAFPLLWQHLYRCITNMKLIQALSLKELYWLNININSYWKRGIIMTQVLSKYDMFSCNMWWIKFEAVKDIRFILNI